MTTTPNANRKTASKKTTRRIARKLNSAFTRKASRAISRRKQLEMKAALERHSRKCIICHHPEREAIEEEFLHWRAPWKLAEDYNLADYRTLYRHARAAGLLLQRRENLHSGLDAFVEAVDDVKFTGDTILRAMRAYFCIDRHGRWTEIPTRVSISTFRDPGPAPSPAPYPENDSDVIDIEPEQLEEDLEEDEEEYDDPEDDDPDDDPDNDAPADEENEEEHSEPASRSDATACAVPPAQALPRDAVRGQNLKDRSPSGRTACAVSPAQPASTVSLNPHHRSRSETAPACADPPAQVTPRNAVRGHNPQSCSVSEHTACADPPAQATPRNAVRGQNPKGRSEPDHTTCAGSSAQDSAHNAAPESAPAPQSGAMQHSNPASRSDSTACAAPPAQAFPVSLRHPGPYGISAPSATGSNPAPQPGFSRIDLIYRPAIRNDGKP